MSLLKLLDLYESQAILVGLDMAYGSRALAADSRYCTFLRLAVESAVACERQRALWELYRVV
jgi:hypothetical protein